VVIAREDTPGDRRLVAYIVPADLAGRSADVADAVRDFAAQRLPEHMVPSAVVILEGFPLTTNGKLDRDALPVPGLQASAGRGPVTALEETICEVFAEVLRLPTVGVDDDFFKLGGNSLLAVSLAARLRNRGIRITVRTLLTAPTVSGFIRNLSLSSVQDALGVLLGIRTQGTKKPFFCVHPAGGLGWCYMPLAQYVPADYPLYGLQAPGLDRTTDLSPSVRDMAAAYVEQIRMVQPEGPYHLLGWSFGGTVAHEIAVQLQAAKEQVAALIIMDTYPLDDASEPRQFADIAQVVESIRQAQGHVLGAMSDEDLMIFARVSQNNTKIRFEHELGRFDGRVLLLVAAAGRPANVPLGGRWEPYVSGEVTEARFPCTHPNMVRPDMLAQAWAAIATWLELDGRRP
jgi:thioesterase domain-containing protein/aryl carrier-like protein